MEKKKCISCDTEKPLFAFEKRADTGKYRNQCTDCRTKYVRQYRKDRTSKQRQKRVIEVIDNKKKCSICNTVKDLSEFPIRKGSNHGYRHECKDCKKKALQKYYQETYNAVRREKKKNDIEYRLLCNHRNYVYKCLTQFKIKEDHSLQYLGCTLGNFKEWLEYLFTKDMSWDNYGTYWTVDHVLPLQQFDLKDKAQQAIAFNWKNLQPSIDNFVKSDNIRVYEYMNILISAHRFIQGKKLDDVEYQGLNESLNWLREKLRYGNNLIDKKSFDVTMMSRLRIDDPQPSSR